MGPKCYAVKCIVNGEETPKIGLSLWYFVTPPEEDRASAIGKTHKTFGKDRACGSGHILADRQTDRHRRTYGITVQYFATASAGEIIRISICVTALLET